MLWKKYCFHSLNFKMSYIMYTFCLLPIRFLCLDIVYWFNNTWDKKSFSCIRTTRYLMINPPKKKILNLWLLFGYVNEEGGITGFVMGMEMSLMNDSISDVWQWFTWQKTDYPLLLSMFPLDGLYWITIELKWQHCVIFVSHS